MIGNKKWNKKVLLKCAYIVLILLVYSIMMITNFGTMSFGTGLRSKQTLYTSLLVISASFIVMILGSAYTKLKHMQNPNIIKDEAILIAYRLYLQAKNIYEEFVNIFIPQRNKERKLDDYRDHIENLRDKKRWWLTADKQNEKVKKYTEIYKETFNEDFDIDRIPFKVRKYTASLFFSKYSGKNGKGSAFYSGWEGFLSKAIPLFIVSIFGIMVTFSFVLYFKEPTIEQIKNMIMMLVISVSFLASGLSFGVDSVEKVYASALDTRKAEIRTFLERKGMTAEVYEIEKPDIQVDIKENKPNG